MKRNIFFILIWMLCYFMSIYILFVFTFVLANSAIMNLHLIRMIASFSFSHIWAGFTFKHFIAMDTFLVVTETWLVSCLKFTQNHNKTCQCGFWEYLYISTYFPSLLKSEKNEYFPKNKMKTKVKMLSIKLKSLTCLGACLLVIYQSVWQVAGVNKLQ